MNKENGFKPKTKLAKASARRAMMLYDEDEFSQALNELEAAIGICPDNSSWHFNKAVILDSLERFDDAIKEYETALQLNPNDLEIMNSLAVDYIRACEYDQALEMFEKVQGLDSDFEPCYCCRIITYAEMGIHEKAEQMFYLAQQINPDCFLCFYNIGASLFARGEHKKAVKCWLRAAELKPDLPQINYRIAQAYWFEGDKNQAREHFLKELREEPGGTEAILDFGLFLLLTGDIDSAREKFNKLLELRPEFAPALFYLGEIAFKRGADYNQAVKLFNQASERDKSLPGPGYRLAQYALMKGFRTEARACLVKEMKLNLEHPDVLVSMGSMFLATGDLDRAVHCLLRAVDIDCASPDAYYYLGLARAVNDVFKDAAEFFAHSLDIRPGDARTLLASALVYFATGRLSEARERIADMRELGMKDPELKALGRRIWLAQVIKHILCGRGKKLIRRFLLNGKKYRSMLERLTGSYRDLDWYPNSNSFVMSKGRKLRYPQMPPFMVKKAEWRISRRS